MFAFLLAAAGLALGLSQLFDDGPTRDERIRDLERTVTASHRRIERGLTEIAELRMTPSAEAD